VTSKRELIFFLNNRQIAAGITTSAGAIYGLIELPGWKGDSVRLIPDPREVRKWK